MRPSPVQRFYRIGLLGFLYLYVSLKAAVRRRIYGPKLEGWPLTLEILTECVQVNVGQRRTFSVRGIQSTINIPSKLVKGATASPILIEDVPAEWVIHESSVDSNRVILFFHGGAYCLMSPQTHRGVTSSISRVARARILSVDYRLAPEHPYPAALDDAMKVYNWLISPEGGKTKPSDIIIAGDSAGGGLTFATMLKIRDTAIPLPAGAIGISPWLDLNCTSESWVSNGQYDYLPKDGAQQMALHYAKTKENFTNPYVSPFYADLSGLPPVLIQCGDAECLRDENIAFAQKLSDAGVEVGIEVYENMVHVFQALFFVAQHKEAYDRIGEFVRGRIPKYIPRKVVISSSSSVKSKL